MSAFVLPDGLDDAYPMTCGQLGMIFHGVADRSRSAYHDIVAVTVRLPWDEQAFRSSLGALVRAHPILRTEFRIEGVTRPLQLVHRNLMPEVLLEDLTADGPGQQAEMIEAWFAAERARGIGPAAGVLVRVGVLRLDPGAWKLCLSFHHALLDGWSVSLLLASLIRTYKQALEGSAPRIAAPTSLYRDFVAEELDAIADPGQRAYWRNALDAAPLTGLVDRSHAGDGVYRLDVDLPAAASSQITGLAARFRVPPKAILLAVHAAALGLIADGRALTLGCVTHGRLETVDGDQVLGLFLNALPVSVNLAGATWPGLVADLFQAERDLWRRRHFPLAEVQKVAGSRSLFTTLFNFTHFRELADAEARGEIGERGGFERSNYPVVLQAMQGADGLSFRLVVEVDAGRLSLADAERIQAAHAAAFEHLIQAPDGPVLSQLPGAGAAARPPLLVTEGRAGQAARPADVPQAVAAETAVQHPSEAIIQTLAGVWEQVLGVTGVSASDDFFELGGDSIRSIQLKSRARDYGLDFDLEALLEAPTLGALAQRVFPALPADPARQVAPFELVSPELRAQLQARFADGLEDACPATQGQMALLFHSEAPRLDGAAIHYQDVVCYQLAAPLDPDRLKESLQLLCQRHPALRSGFLMDVGADPLLVVHRHVAPCLVLLETAQAGTSPRAALQDHVEREARAGFAWDGTPPIRFAAMPLDAESFALAITFHHALLDGWSEAGLVAELLSLLAAAPQLPVRNMPFRVFAAHERRILGSPAAEQHWRTVWAEAARAPAGLLAAERLGSGTRLEVPIPIQSDVSDSLVRLAAREKLPLKSILLAVHLKALGLLSGQDRASTGVIVHGRPDCEGSTQTLGLFVNTIPLAMTLAGDNWAGLARRVWQQELAAHRHRAFPLGEMKHRFGGELPFEAVFNFTRFHVRASASHAEAGAALEAGARVAITDRWGIAANHFPVTVEFWSDPTDGRIGGMIVCDPARLAWRRPESLAALYAATLEACAADPLQPHALMRVTPDAPTEPVAARPLPILRRSRVPVQAQPENSLETEMENAARTAL